MGGISAPDPATPQKAKWAGKQINKPYPDIVRVGNQVKDRHLAVSEALDGYTNEGSRGDADQRIATFSQD